MLALLLAAALSCAEPLFVVERSTNANVVVYEARRSPDGPLDAERPVDVSWQLADGRREPLTVLERAWAYGIDVAPEGEGFRLSIHALPSRLLFLATGEDGCPSVFAEIDGGPAVLRRVFVDVRGGGIFPRVLGVELEGRRPGGEPVRERISPR